MYQNIIQQEQNRKDQATAKEAEHKSNKLSVLSGLLPNARRGITLGGKKKC